VCGRVDAGLGGIALEKNIKSRQGWRERWLDYLAQCSLICGQVCYAGAPFGASKAGSYGVTEEARWSAVIGGWLIAMS